MKRKSSYFSKKTKTEKARVTVYISDDLFEKVSKIVPEVYGTLRGGLSFAVEDSLKLWLLSHSGALLGARQNPRPAVREVYNQVMCDLSGTLGTLNPDFIPTSLPAPGLMACVMRALNVKDRAAAGWIFRFYTEGLVKPLIPPKVTLHKPSDVLRIKSWELVAKEA